MIGNFSASAGLTGGVLIGFAAVILFGGIGRIAGISGTLAGILSLGTQIRWQAAFILGLIVSGLAFQFVEGKIEIDVSSPLVLLVISGLLVGFGTRLGNGCTSGHGVCGTARLSRRSIFATITFIGFGILTVLISSQV